MKLKKALSLVLAVLMIVSTMTFVTVTTAAAGNVAKIGTTEYATVDAAIDAAKDGDTITLLADVALTTANKAVNVNITIDGAGHKITGPTAANSYCWLFYKGATIKNVTGQSAGLCRYYYNETTDTELNLENVTWVLTTRCLVIMHGKGTEKAMTLNIRNTHASKVTDGTGTDPMISGFVDNPADGATGITVDINIEDSTITNCSNSGNWNNLAIFCLSTGAGYRVNLKGNTVLSSAPTKHSSYWTSVFSASRPVTINADATAKIILAPTSADATKNSFFNGNDKFTVNDAGAAWIMSNTAVSQGTTIPTGLTYNGAAVTAMTTKEAGATETTMQFTAEGAKTVVARIGDTTYANLDDAMAAALDDETVNLMADTTLTKSNVRIFKTLTLDGSGHYITGPTTGNAYCWLFHAGATIKNVVGTSAGFCRYYYNPTKDTSVTLENVTWVLTTRTMTIMHSNDQTTGDAAGNGGNKSMTLNYINCDISKVVDGTATDPSISGFLNNSTADVKSPVVEINLIDTSIKNCSNSTNWGNLAIFSLYQGEGYVINLKGNTVLENSPSKNAAGATSICSSQIPTTVNIEEGVTFKVPAVVADATKNYVFYDNGKGNVFTINDEGADYIMGNKVIEQGLAVAKGMIYNGKSVVATYVKEKGETESKIGYLTMNDGDVALNAGASIRTDAPNAISFSGTIDKAFYDQIKALDDEVTITMYLVTKENLDKVVQDGTPNLNLIAERNKLQFNKIILTDSEDGKTKTFRGCYYGVEDVKQEYAVIAYVTYYLGDVMNTINITYSEEDHVRSVYEVATKAVADTKYANNEYLKAIASAS